MSTGQASGWQEFKGDLKLALSAWRKAPALPTVSLLLSALIYVPAPWSILFLPVAVISLGWFGAERIWYLRIYRDLPVTAGELWKVTPAFIARYFVLALLALIVLLPVGFIAGMLTSDSFGRASQPNPLGFSIPLALGIAGVHIWFTFVTQALAFTSTQIGPALRIGIRTLRTEWPHSAWYALVPPLVFVVGFFVDPAVEARPSSEPIAGLVITLPILLFKGATAAFYLRRHEVGDWGAAFEDSREAAADSGAGEKPPDTT